MFLYTNFMKKFSILTYTNMDIVFWFSSHVMNGSVRIEFKKT